MFGNDHEPAAEIKILDINKHIKDFDSPADFNKYYSKHKAEIDGKTTNQLNVEYTIPGFKITRRHVRIVNGVKIGDICLKAIRESSSKSQRKLRDKVDDDEETDESKETNSELVTIHAEINDLYAKITQLNELYKQLATIVNSIVSETTACH